MKILELRLATSSLAAQIEFYNSTLGLPIIAQSGQATMFQVGQSRLTFEAATHEVPGVYHFAFNIPHNQFEAARQWIESRAALLADVNGETTFYSEHWNAHMLYFLDPQGNVLELIARHTLANDQERFFDAASLLNISEIGIATEDVAAQVADVMARTASPVYRGPGSNTFTAVGDEYGLAIIVQQGRIWFPDTGKPAAQMSLTVIIDQHPQPVTLSTFGEVG